MTAPVRPSASAGGQRDPYRITGPAQIAFSGGRTSGYLLAQILAAHGGTLPPDVRLVFTNTGREHPGTLRFFHDVESRWGIRVPGVSASLDRVAGHPGAARGAYRIPGVTGGKRLARPEG